MRAMDLQPFRAAIEDTLRVRGWSLNRLGREAKIQASVISRWLNVPEGATASRPSPANLEKLAPVIGLPHEELMRMCGYLTGAAGEQIDAMRQARRDQLEAWVTAVGPENEAYFWSHLTAQAESTARLILELKTAVNQPAGTAVSGAVSDPPKRPRRGRRGTEGPLTVDLLPLVSRLGASHSSVDRRYNLVDRRRVA